jgi:hypothetical protein
MMIGLLVFVVVAAAAVWALARPKRLTRSQPPGLRKRVLEVTMNGWLGRKMTSMNWAGTTIPLPGFVLMMFWIGPDVPVLNPYVRFHEFVHVQQDVDAKWWFVAWAQYIREWAIEAWRHTASKWDFLKPWKWYAVYQAGYWNNKFELQAYAATGAVHDAQSLPDWV